jgi:hypothetical protein
MKRIVIAAALVGMLNLGAFAEPVFMPQAASVLKSRQLETGVNAQFGYQSSSIEGVPDTTNKDRVWMIPFFVRLGVADSAEAKLSVPVVRAIDSQEGTTSSYNANTGMGNMQLSGKWNFAAMPAPLALGVDLDLPTANSANNRAPLGQRYNTQAQQGFNTHIYVAGDTPKMGLMTGHGMVGYMNTATYTTTSKVRFNPSDLFTFGASLDLDLAQVTSGFSASAEMVGNTGLTHARDNGTIHGNDLGTVLEAGPALRYQRGSWRTNAGVLFDAGKATFRAYNYRVAFGISYLCGSSH